MKNYYGSLCTEMYEILHKDAPEDELDFYLSYTIFISSGSVSLFTDMVLCRKILKKMKWLLKKVANLFLQLIQ